MLAKIAIGLLAIIAILVAVIATRPDDFSVSRSAVMAAPPQAIYDQINDFKKWEAWSPWAKLDPKAKNTFGGPPAGVGSTFAWAGDHNVGEGKQTIEESRPGELIRIKLEFFKPFAGTNETLFTFKPEDNGTLVAWTMSGKNNFMSKAMSLVMDCDKMIGGFFDQGLSSIKAIVEAPPKA